MDKVERKTDLIFDLDGTLWDSREQVAEAWAEVALRRYGKTDINIQKVASVMGLPMNELALAIAPSDLPEEEKFSFAEEAFAYENEYLLTRPGKPFDGVVSTLTKLKEKGVRLFIVSNCQKGYIETFLPTVPESLFDGYLCYGDTLGQKSETILALKEKFGISNSIYVGDTAGDEKEAKKAGCLFCFASYGFGTSIDPDFVINSFSELIKLFE